MRIKSLELIGFKSFYEETTIHFQDGINAIVGPNGCGKSNILDAIRWALGEQNPRRLRAEAMEEVVSNGSETLKPLGMAEASLVLTDVPKLGFDEVIIKRRLFRSGESEYYINGTSCRLKDITEMFVDTGVGARAYSIIDQGKVEHLITAKPEERRTVIEEVAGIVKYRIRRRETERRIESTKENLRRVKDVLDEVGRQMATLSRQAKDAEEFRCLSERARHIELRIIVSKLYQMEEGRKRLLDEKRETENAASSLGEALEKKETVLEDTKSGILLIEQKLEGLGKEVYEIKGELQAKEAMREIARNEASGIDKFIEKLEKEIELLKEENEKTEGQFDLKEKTLEEVQADLSSIGLELTRKEEALSKLKAEFIESQAKLEATRATLFETLNKYGSLKGAAFGYEKELTDLKLRRERTEKEIKELNLEREKTSSRILELESVLKDTEEQKDRIGETKKSITLSLSSLSTNEELKSKENASLNERLKEAYSRLNVLKEIEANYEWLPEGVRRFLLEKKENGILGVIADFISVPKGYEKALEAAFGEKLKWALVKESEEALRAVDSLRELSLGRGTFIPISNARKNGNFEKNGKDIVPLGEIIKVEGIDKYVIEDMLKGVFVVSSLREALSLRDEIKEDASFVTLEGDLLHSTGAISGGPTTEGVFERKREIEELSVETLKLQEELLGVSEEIKLIQAEIQELQSVTHELQKESVEVEIKEAEIRKDISNLGGNLEKAEMRFELIQFDLKGIDSEILEKEEKLKETLVALRSLEDEKTLLEKKFSEIKENVERSEGEERSLEREITDLRVESATLIEKENSLKEDLDELHRRQEEIGERIKLEAKDIEKKKQEKLSLIKTDEDAKEEFKRLLEVLKKKEEELAINKNERDTLLYQAKTAQEEKEGLRRRLTELQEKVNALGLGLNSIQIEIEHLIKSVQENGLNMDQVDGARVFSPESFEWKDEEANLKKLKEQIEKFGPVNLLAPEEYKNLEERHKFLSDQMEDLVNAISSLRKAMNKIDRESEKRFNESFEVVNKKFQEIFSRLFRGGEGKLVLTNYEDLLQTGVEVMVRPKGKRFQSVNLLSGGEKALSAIALTLSACFIRPAPFLLFDEIDAPLDDVNTAQFTDLLKEVANESQVVIVTHNKKTMQFANSLIGITSDKPGASKVVSVELREI